MVALSKVLVMCCLVLFREGVVLRGLVGCRKGIVKSGLVKVE